MLLISGLRKETVKTVIAHRTETGIEPKIIIFKATKTGRNVK